MLNKSKLAIQIGPEVSKERCSLSAIGIGCFMNDRMKYNFFFLLFLLYCCDATPHIRCRYGRTRNSEYSECLFICRKLIKCMGVAKSKRWLMAILYTVLYRFIIEFSLNCTGAEEINARLETISILDSVIDEMYLLMYVFSNT